jgi:hypothetical protein
MTHQRALGRDRHGGRRGALAEDGVAVEIDSLVEELL